MATGFLHNLFLIRFLMFSFLVSVDSIAAQSIDSLKKVVDSVTTVDDYEAETAGGIHFDSISVDDKMKVTPRGMDPDKVAELRKDEDFWYVNTQPEREKVQNRQTPFLNKFITSPWLKTFLWFLVIGGFVAILFWFLASSNIRLFKKKAVGANNPNEEIKYSDINYIDFSSEIGNATNAKNFGLAIRFMYLQTLQTLSQKNMIQYNQHKTNSDYVFELFGTKWYSEFFSLTRTFEYANYGHFHINTTAFDRIQKDFKNFVSSIHS